MIGDAVELYVDANGGYSRKQAVRIGRELADDSGVTWFEEPVSSDDLAGLREVRDQSTPTSPPASTATTRPTSPACSTPARSTACRPTSPAAAATPPGCGRPHVAGAHGLQISGHCAPNLHAHVAGGVPNLRHVEYFHDHVRLDPLLFDGALDPTAAPSTPTPPAPAWA